VAVSRKVARTHPANKLAEARRPRRVRAQNKRCLSLPTSAALRSPRSHFRPKFEKISCRPWHTRGRPEGAVRNQEDGATLFGTDGGESSSNNSIWLTCRSRTYTVHGCLPPGLTECSVVIAAPTKPYAMAILNAEACDGRRGLDHAVEGHQAKTATEAVRRRVATDTELMLSRQS
jgi:hypothetical protein